MHRYIILFASLFFLISAKAENFHDTALKILRESPQYKSENLNLESSFLQLKTESNLPDPEIGGEYLWAPEREDTRWAAELTWGLEWPGVYGARARQASFRYSAQQQMILLDRAERLAEIKDLLLDYIQCRLKLEILAELNRSNDTIYSLSENSAKGGEMTVLDLNKVKLEYANIKGAQAALKDEMAEAESALSVLYGQDATPLLKEMPCEFPVIVLPSEEEMEAIKSTAPSVKKALAETEAARQNKNVAKMEALPAISFGYKHAFEENTHFNGATLGISIPVFSSRGKQRAAEAEISAMEYNVEQARIEADTEAEMALKRLKIISEQIKEIEPVIRSADYHAALLRAYKGGVITLIDYLTDRNYFTNAEIELLTLKYQDAKSQARLYKYLQASEL